MGSVKDQEQKASGNYFFNEEDTADDIKKEAEASAATAKSSGAKASGAKGGKGGGKGKGGKK